MNRPSSHRALRASLCASLLVAFVEACSGDDTTLPPPPVASGSIAIDRIYLGRGGLGEGGSASELDCEYTIGVVLRLDNGWTLRPPGLCSISQCGHVNVSLLALPEGVVLSTQSTASVGVDLDLRRLLDDPAMLQSGTYAIRADLVDDAGKPLKSLEGEDAFAQSEFELRVPRDCSAPAGAAGAGAAGSGTAGSGGSSDQAGTGGAGETGNVAGSGGTAEDPGSG